MHKQKNRKTNQSYWAMFKMRGALGLCWRVGAVSPDLIWANLAKFWSILCSRLDLHCSAPYQIKSGNKSFTDKMSNLVSKQIHLNFGPPIFHYTWYPRCPTLRPHPTAVCFQLTLVAWA